jgi:hypothetical protein
VKVNKKVAKQINGLAKKDQQLRRNFDENKDKIREFDLHTSQIFKELLAQIGLPTISKIGKKASYNAWLLVQHSPDLQFQKEYLQLMKENAKDIDPRNIAYLEDRVLMYQGKPQIYGTQLVLDEKTGKYKAYELQNEIKVDALRKEVNLSSLESYLEEFNRGSFQM